MITQQLINAPTADSAANTTAADVLGNKTDTVAGNSVVAVAKQVKAKTDLIGTITNTGGTAELGAALGDFNNVTLVSRLNTIDDFLDTEVAAIKVETDQIGTVVNTGGTATLAGALGDVANVSLASRLTTIDDFLDTEVAAIKTETDQIGTVVNTGGTATLGGVLGDFANTSLVSRLNTIDDLIDTEIGTPVNTGGTASISALLGDMANVSAATRLANFGTLVNTGGTATLGGILGDVNNVSVASSLSTISTDTNKIEDAALSGTPTANSLSRFIATGGTALGTQLPASKSLYDMIQEHGDGYLATKTITYDGSASYAAFTVTGGVRVEVYGTIDTALSNVAGTTSVGTVTAAAGIIAATAGSAMQTTGNIWVDTAPSNLESPPLAIMLGNGEDITVAGGATLAAGVVTLYCFWKPRTTGATVVAA